MNQKIIQIIPAPENLHVIHQDDQGGEFTTRVVCLGLTDEGEVFMMDTDDYGMVAEISTDHNELKWDYPGAHKD